MENQDISSLMSDKIIHERARLLIVTYLASSEKRAVPFNELKEKFEFTAGNLSIQLKTLKDAGYITITKEFMDNKPLTKALITARGSNALKRYMDQMEKIIKMLK